MKREPGFMGLAKLNKRMGTKRPMSPEQMKFLQELGQQNIADQQQEVGMQDKMAAYNRLQEAKQSLIEVPKNYQTPEGEMESLAYISPEEAEMLREEGGSGEMTEYGIPSFKRRGISRGAFSRSGRRSSRGARKSRSSAKKERSARNMRNDRREARFQAMSDHSLSLRNQGGRGPQGRRDLSRGRGFQGGPPQRQGTPMSPHARSALQAGLSHGGNTGSIYDDPLRDKADRDRIARENQRYENLKSEFDKYKGGEAERNKKAAEDRLKAYQGEKRQKLTDEYGGYKGEYKDLGKESKDLTAGFGEDVTKLGEYQGKFDTMAGEAKTRGDDAATKYENIAGKGAEAATEGATGFKEGAADVGAVKEQFGQEGFQKEAGALQDKMAGLEARTGAMADRGAGYESKLAQMGEQAMSGEVGQEQAEMLKGRMEEQRMASTKGSEEKLRRELAASGASPAEIAAKVAQFQTSSAANQAQAGRSETLQSQIQGQQMGQQQLAQAGGFMQSALGAMNPQMQAQQQLQQQMQGQAGMLGQKAGMAGQQASLGAQQAALRGQAAGMEMQGKQMAMQGVQGGAQLGFQGQQQQAAMMGQGMGAVQAAGGARQQQMGGLDQQGRMIGSQAGMTTAQLGDVVAQQTQQYNKEQAEKQRAADAAANSGGGGGGSGGLLGGLLSDIRLKENIELLEEGKDGEPNIYSFNYKFQPNHRWSGVMAQELLGTKHSDSVKTNSDGYYMVDYHKLGIQMKLLT